MKNKKNIVYNILTVTLFLCVLGMIMVYSSSAAICGMSEKYNFDTAYLLKKQFFYIVAGLMVALLFQYFNYNRLYRMSILIYLFGLSCIFLLLTSKGISVNGATRWLNIYGITFQVAEVVKVCVIMFEAYMIKRFYYALNNKKLTFYLWGVGVGAALLLKKVSNDLSSSVVILGITFGITFIYTNTMKLHMEVLSTALAGIILYVYKISKNLPSPEDLNQMSFRVGRIAAWLAPEKYARNQAFQSLQALYAIGRGGWLGKGLGSSIQKLGAIPEAQNDMIFSVICEELGMFGAVVLVYLFVFLLYYLLKAAIGTKDLFGSVIITGILFHIGIQVIMNIAVNLNVVPNTGIALPFISYGGTAVFVQLVEVALVLSVVRNGNKNIKESTHA